MRLPLLAIKWIARIRREDEFYLYFFFIFLLLIVNVILQPNLNRANLTHQLNLKHLHFTQLFCSSWSPAANLPPQLIGANNQQELQLPPTYGSMEIQQQHVSFIHNNETFYTPPLHCCVCVKRPHLEPIKEEVEDEGESETEEKENEDFQNSVEEDDEDDELTVLRPKTSRSCSQTFPQVHLNRSQQEDTRQLFSSIRNISAPPKRSFQLSKIRWQKRATPKPSRRRRQKDPYVSSSHQPPQILTFGLRNPYFVLLLFTKGGSISWVAGRRDDQHRRSKKSPTGGRVNQITERILFPLVWLQWLQPSGTDQKTTVVCFSSVCVSFFFFYYQFL